MTKIKLNSFCISALHQRWDLGNPNIQTHDIAKNKDRDKFACWIVLQSISYACLDLRDTREGCLQNWNKNSVFHVQEKKKNSPGTPQTCSPSPREDNQQDKSSLLLTLTPETDTTQGAHHPEGQQQEITPRSRLLEGAEKGTTFINNKLYHIYTQTH